MTIKTYFTHFNGARPYMVTIDRGSSSSSLVNIYEIDKDNISKKELNEKWSQVDFENKWAYTKHCGKYKPEKIFVGKDTYINLHMGGTSSGSFGDGNSILLELKNNVYVFIGYEIREFKVQNNDRILRFYSPITGSDVACPFAIGTKYIYFFSFPDGYLDKMFFDKINDLEYVMNRGNQLEPFLISLYSHDIQKNLPLTIYEFMELKNRELKNIPMKTIRAVAKLFSVATSGTKKVVVDRIFGMRGILIYAR